MRTNLLGVVALIGFLAPLPASAMAVFLDNMGSDFGALTTIDKTTIDGFSNSAVRAHGSEALLAQQSAVGAASAVPEAATWGMMLSGFFAAGGFVRGRRRFALRYA